MNLIRIEHRSGVSIVPMNEIIGIESAVASYVQDPYDCPGQRYKVTYYGSIKIKTRHGGEVTVWSSTENDSEQKIKDELEIEINRFIEELNGNITLTRTL